ncbi:conserved hypothetical protein [Desulfosarcina cetonica]|uniref:hypothetical protein n=1 Tax=Desulfosarcina cetonica TaxID=90730 RepID=UPI0009FABF1E|nr:hypothetical protein [Desulfosarcina cetonica]VTR69868.1 conserved hypothetical protein [Desulfosarcina cetonica]
MIHEERIKTPKALDRKIIDCFKMIADEYNVDQFNVTAFGFLQNETINIQSENEIADIILSNNGTLISRCSVNVKELSITFFRGGNYTPDKQSAVLDEIVLRYNDQKPEHEKLLDKERLRIAALLIREFKAFDPKEIIPGVLSEEQKELLSIHESVLSRLEKLNEELVSKSANFRDRIENKYETKIVEYEALIKEKEINLNKEYSEKENLLTIREKEIADKLKAVDDRNNTHVRREIRNRMLDDVNNRIKNFGVSRATENKRIPVRFGILVMILLTLILLIYTGYEISTSETRYASDVVAKQNEFASFDKIKIYWLWGRFIVFSFVLLGTVLYYIKWENKWAEHHESTEFQLQQFYIDVNRANWVIESCLEWRKETKNVIPSELLKSITRNLFLSEIGEHDKVIHPADELASALLGNASKLKLNLNGNEIEFGKPEKIPKRAILKDS